MKIRSKVCKLVGHVMKYWNLLQLPSEDTEETEVRYQILRTASLLYEYKLEWSKRGGGKDDLREHSNAFLLQNRLPPELELKTETISLSHNLCVNFGWNQIDCSFSPGWLVHRGSATVCLELAELRQCQLRWLHSFPSLSSCSRLVPIFHIKAGWSVNTEPERTGFLRLGSEMNTRCFLLHSITKLIHKGDSEEGKRFHFLVGRAAKSPCKGHGYREELRLCHFLCHMEMIGIPTLC